MEINERKVGRVRIIRVQGQATLNTNANILSKLVQERLEEGERLFVINLADCQRMDSSGLGELIKTHGEISKREGVLKLSDVPLRLRGLMITSNLVQILEILDTEQEAIISFGD
jgi:anti-anti-sigma factor